MAVSIPRESIEYVWWEVSVSRGDIGAATVEVALLADAEGRPTEPDWVTGTLIDPDHAQGVAGKHFIRLLIGPAGAAGVEWEHAGAADYQSWARVTSSPEVVVRRPGVVTVT